MDRLISASVGTVVYYGFKCQPTTRDAFLLLCFAIGVSGSIFPFMNWFNMREYKVLKGVARLDSQPLYRTSRCGLFVPA